MNMLVWCVLSNEDSCLTHDVYPHCSAHVYILIVKYLNVTQGIIFWTSTHAVCNHTSHGNVDSIHTSHALLWYSFLYSDGVARVFTASQERKASPDQIAVSYAVMSVGMLVQKKVQSCFEALLVHFHHHALSVFDKMKQLLHTLA